MKHFFFFFLFIAFSSFAYGEEECDDSFAKPGASDITEVAIIATKDCSDRTLNHQELCRCLADAKFNEAKVGKKTKDDFHKSGFDKSLREKLNHAVHDQIANFTKFSNFLRTKEHLGNLIDDSQPLCDLNTIARDIEATQKLAGSAECPSPKGFMPNRLKEIFGTSDPTKITEKLNFETIEVNNKSCIPTKMYLDLRSNSGAAGQGLRSMMTSGDFDIKTFIKDSSESDKDAYKDLLSYDVYFNLAYRDPEFQNSLNQNIAKIQESGGKSFDIYNDPATLKEAFKSLNRSCNDLMKNVKGFLCANDHPKFDGPIMRDHLEDYLSGKPKLSPSEKTAMRDHFTQKYACAERTAVVYRRSVGQLIRGEDKVVISQSEEEKALNDYISNVVLLKTTTENFKSDDPKTDLNTFNKMFCQGREGKSIAQEDLPLMLEEFIKSYEKNNNGKSIAQILEDEDLQRKLGLKITTNPISFSLIHESDINAGHLPKINQFKWQESMGKELLKSGMSKEEVGQLYAIIEMQTNRKFSEMTDLKVKLISDNQNFENVSVADIYAVSVNKDPIAIQRVNHIANSSSVGSLSQDSASPPIDAVAAIESRYEALKTDSTKNADVAQSLLRGETSKDQLKQDATVYNNNAGTYDSKFAPSKEKGESQNFLPSSPLPPKAPSVAQQEPGRSITETTPPPQNRSLANSEAAQKNTNNATVMKPNISSSSESSALSESVNNDSSSSNSSGWKSHKDSSYNPDEDDYIKDMKKRIDQTKARISEMDKAESFYQDQANSLNSNSSRPKKPNQDSTTSSNFSTPPQIDPDYNYPRNVPMSDGKGNSFYPEKFGELSSNNKKLANSQADPEGELSSGSESSSSHAGAGPGNGGPGSPNSGSSATASIGATDSIGPLAGIGKDLPSGSPKTPKESEEETKKRLAIPAYEFPKIIPHALVEMVGSQDKVVLIMGLEGKKFKTIEAIQTFEAEGSTKASVKYNIRTYDFVPDGEFEDMKEDFINKEAREETFQKYFGFPRTRENMIISKKYAQGTKEISKQEFPHSYVLKIQNEIMKESELKDIIQSVSERIK